MANEPSFLKLRTGEKILWGLVILFMLFTLASYFLSEEFDIKCEKQVECSRDELYQSLINLNTWPEWLFWSNKMDSSFTLIPSDTMQGKGAHYSWTGRTMSAGGLRLTELHPDEGLSFKLSMDKGRFILNGDVSLAENGSGTLISWHQKGHLRSGISVKWLKFISLDRKLRQQIEKNLTGLKAWCENPVASR